MGNYFRVKKSDFTFKLRMVRAADLEYFASEETTLSIAPMLLLHKGRHDSATRFNTAAFVQPVGAAFGNDVVVTGFVSRGASFALNRAITRAGNVRG